MTKSDFIKNISERGYIHQCTNLDELAENCHKYARLCGIKKFHEWIEVYERGRVPEDMLGLPRVIHPLTEEDIISQKNKGDDE